MAEKTVKAKQTESEKPNLFQKARTAADKEKTRGDKPAQPNAIVKWWRETIGELRKVSWPTTQDSWRMTGIVLIVMTLMSIVLWFFDFLFSRFISLLIS